MRLFSFLFSSKSMAGHVLVISISLVCLISLLTSAAGAEESRHAPIARGPRQARGVQKQKEEFPSYPSRIEARKSPVFRGRPDSLGNRVTESHLSRVTFANNRIESHMRPDPHVNQIVARSRAVYVNSYRPEFDHRAVFINTGIHHYNLILAEHPAAVARWHQHYFYGGYYYGFHPVMDIDAYFYNPVVYWFYQPAVDNDYYRNWYKDQYDAYPALQTAFAYHGLYYPTENLRQLLFGVSAMPVAKQISFREAISQFTRLLAQNLANSLHQHIRLATGDIVVNHYETLGAGEALTLEGVVALTDKDYSFKGLLDLETPSHTSVVAPVSLDQDPTPEQISHLDQMNSQITELGGESVSPPSEMPPVKIVPGEITADPN